MHLNKSQKCVESNLIESSLDFEFATAILNSLLFSAEQLLPK